MMSKLEKLSGWFVEDGDYYGPFATHDAAYAFRDHHRIDGQICQLTFHRVSSRETTLTEYEREHRSCPHIIDPDFVFDPGEQD